MKNESLSNRMKKYEDIYRNKMSPRMPVIIRLDGKSFHTWTKGLDKPFDDTYIAIMANVMKQVTDNIQGAVFSYCQSDEISIFIRNYDNINSQSWFDNNIQKMVSVAASMTTAVFNKLVNQTFDSMPLALFDARAFTLPKDEIINYFIYRQNDAIRNSIRGLAVHYLGHDACIGKSNIQVKEMMRELDQPIDWDYLPIHKKRGMAYNTKNNIVDALIPVFSESREYIGVHIEKGEDLDEME
jgi:tRNA(His) 5'-end guanylyltransferase